MFRAWMVQKDESLFKKEGSKDYQFMSQAIQLAKHGQYTCDPNPIVGCVIIKNDSVVSEGWHAMSGQPHAEINALLKLDYNNPKRKIMYVTLSPCRMCAKAAVNSGIDEVVYDEEYRDTSGLDILRDAGIICRKM